MKKDRGCFVRKWYYIFQTEKKNKFVFFTKKWCFFWGTGNIADAGQKPFRHFRRDKKINFNFESLFKIEMIVIIISSKWKIFCLYEPKQWISFFGIKNIKKLCTGCPISCGEGEEASQELGMKGEEYGFFPAALPFLLLTRQGNFNII